MENQKNGSLDRRTFLAAVSAAGLGMTTTSTCLNGQETNKTAIEMKSLDLNDIIDSYPLLQNPMENSLNVVWAIKRPGTGLVEWGKTKNLDQMARDSRCGLYPYDDRFLTAHLSGLEPNTTYYYRTVTTGLDFPRYGKMVAGDPIRSDIYSFTTPGPNTKKASFAVMNDTHENVPTLKALTKRLAELKPDDVVWNGDLLNDVNSIDQVVKGIAKAGDAPFAAERPILFTCGNHDHRGPWARNLRRLLLPWTYQDPKFQALGYNYVVRRGPLAIIGMDTGEDKPDHHPVWEGLSHFEPYRKLQGEWLEATLASEALKSVPFLVVCCHIPLFDPDPTANPGNILEGYASWQADCATYWAPSLEKYGVQAVIVGHRHSFVAHLPEGKRTWLQVRGGGPQLENNAVLIGGDVENNQLNLWAEQLIDGKELGRWNLAPRC